MTRRQRIRRYVALVIAVVLIAAFVLYRAGFGASSLSGSKSTFIFVGSNITPPTPSPGQTPAAQPEPPVAAKPGE